VVDGVVVRVGAIDAKEVKGGDENGKLIGMRMTFFLYSWVGLEWGCRKQSSKSNSHEKGILTLQILQTQKIQVRNECGTPMYAAVLLGIFLRISIYDCLITILCWILSWEVCNN
jgi:hypothetical protein